jgi:hypothetical protein
MHPVCPQTLIANYTNFGLQRQPMEVKGFAGQPLHCANVSIR